MALTKLKKEEIVKKYARHEGDTGSPEIQIALLTEEINDLTEHLKQHPQDNHSRRGLLEKVGRRNNMKNYLRNLDINRYRVLINSLGLRK